MPEQKVFVPINREESLSEFTEIKRPFFMDAFEYTIGQGAFSNVFGTRLDYENRIATIKNKGLSLAFSENQLPITTNDDLINLCKMEEVWIVSVVPKNTIKPADIENLKAICSSVREEYAKLVHAERQKRKEKGKRVD